MAFFLTGKPRPLVGELHSALMVLIDSSFNPLAAVPSWWLFSNRVLCTQYNRND
jgi:hypothetical protein